MDRRSCLPTCSIITRTGRILDSLRTRQQVGLQQFALRVKTRFNPFRDSVACTIVMRWQRRFKSCFSESQILFCNPARHSPRSLRAFSRIDESACNPKPKNLRQGERNPFSGARRFGELQPACRLSVHLSHAPAGRTVKRSLLEKAVEAIWFSLLGKGQC